MDYSKWIIETANIAVLVTVDVYSPITDQGRRIFFMAHLGTPTIDSNLLGG